MNNDKTIANMKILINNLSKENETLKTQLAEAVLNAEAKDKAYNDNMQRANDIIKQCSEAMADFNTAISEAKTAKCEYDNSVREIAMLKKQYEKKLKKLIK